MTTTNFIDQQTPIVASWLNDTNAAVYAGPGGTKGQPFTQSGTGAVTRTVQGKLQETISAADFTGYDPTGIADSATAINNALAASLHVIIPAGHTPLIASSVTVPAHAKLQFLGGLGNTNMAYPASYLIKKSTMTTTALIVSDTAYVEGGGLVCQGGNTGDGVVIQGNNGKVRDFLVHGAGGVGVRVGTAGGANVNSYQLDHVTAQYCGSHGIMVHDGTAAQGANANVGTLIHCFVQYNGGDGIHIGHAFWTMLVNCLSENNTGWGLYLSGTTNNGYPECRYATIIGGDYNEGNVAGQVYDNSYLSQFIQTDSHSLPVNVRSGSGSVSQFLSPASNILQGLSVYGYGFKSDGGYSGGVTYPVWAQGQTTASNGDGVGYKIKVTTDGTNYRDAATLQVEQATTNQDNLIFTVNKTGVLLRMLGLYSNASAVAPGVDATYSLGLTSLRWSGVYVSPMAVASLPAAASSTGGRFMVNNANAVTFNSVVVGGGANTVPVYSDGTNWRIG
jgi:hypothetical protein